MRVWGRLAERGSGMKSSMQGCDFPHTFFSRLSTKLLSSDQEEKVNDSEGPK